MIVKQRKMSLFNWKGCCRHQSLHFTHQKVGIGTVTVVIIVIISMITVIISIRLLFYMVSSILQETETLLFFCRIFLGGFERNFPPLFLILAQTYFVTFSSTFLQTFRKYSRNHFEILKTLLYSHFCSFAFIFSKNFYAFWIMTF